jgi:polyhydroxyalkanoate synthase subunit PhaC
MQKAAARSAKSDARPKAIGEGSSPREKGDQPRFTGALRDVADDHEDGPTRAASEKLSGQFGVGNFVPSDLPEIAKEVFSRAAQQPIPLLKASLGLTGELVKIAAGQSSLAADSSDKRFADPAWRESWVYRSFLQSYLAWGTALQKYVRDASPDAREAQRAAFLASQIVDAMAPTNTLLLNPSATKRLIETGGESAVRGVSNLLEDVGRGRVIPSQSDDRSFKVGENLAATPGSVVLRTEMFELIQYAPQTPNVFERPFLFVPALVNKFYVFDLAPGRSLFEYFIKKGVTFFSMAWRNPSPEHDSWGVEEYQEGVDQAIAAVLEITGANDVNLWGVCGASPVVVSLVGYYVATRQRKVNSLGFLVPILDLGTLANSEGIGSFIGPKKTGGGRGRRRAGRMSARDFGLLFALLRSNDLIWNYWVSNYLMGNDPPTFDILTWNNDGTGMAAKFNEEFADMIDQNPLVTPGAMQFRGVQIAALDKLGIDSYVVGAATDHICRWASVYRSALLLGERCEFVLGSSGHIQTLVCPPGNVKSGYFTNGSKPSSPDQWLQTAQKHVGTWWDHCVAWLGERSGKLVPAPSSLGSADHPPIGNAPGVYVLEKV